jgi:hypothetical protein
MKGMLVSLVLMFGCAEKVYDGPPGSRPPSDQAGYREGREGAIDAARIAAEVACERLWGDCSSLCNSDFVYCGNSEQSCVENYALSAVEDLLYPVYSKDLAERCAEQLGRRSCLDLNPNSAECNAAIVEGCLGDNDDYGRPYSWLAAHQLDSLPVTLRPHLCEDTPEWFVFQLEAGETVSVTVVGGTGTAWLSLNAPVGGVDAQDVQEVGHSIHIDPASTNQDTESFMAAPTAGFYYLEIDLNEGPIADMEISIGTDRRQGPTATDVALETESIVYRALCERLHGDCSIACADSDFYCGASVDQCTDAYSRSAVEFIFDGDPRPLDRGKAAACAAELSQKACNDLGSPSSACGELLVTHCATDPNAFARPWSGRMAESLALPVVVDLDLCDDVRQFYTFDLNAGDRLVMRTQVDPLDSAYGYLFPPTATEEDLANSDNYLFWSFYLDSQEIITDPVPMSGRYFYTVEYNANGPIRLMLRKL